MTNLTESEADQIEVLANSFLRLVAEWRQQRKLLLEYAEGLSSDLELHPRVKQFLGFSYQDAHRFPQVKSEASR